MLKTIGSLDHIQTRHYPDHAKHFVMEFWDICARQKYNGKVDLKTATVFGTNEEYSNYLFSICRNE